MSRYLGELKKRNINPNFYCSEEYFEKAGWIEDRDEENVIIIFDFSKSNIMLPVIDLDSIRFLSSSFYAGFCNLNSVCFKEDIKLNFLDYEFIYDPSQFLSLSGNKWKKVRKNLKWCREDFGKLDAFYTYENYDQLEIDNFLNIWVNSMEGQKLYDPEVFLKYIFFGKNRLLFKNNKGVIKGIACWDENWKYINFRYCLVNNSEGRGLSDTCRVLFYRYINACMPGKLVNDGGSLGIPSLYKYKEKLNPIEINKIYGGKI